MTGRVPTTAMPCTLEAALARIAHLEAQLAVAAQLVREQTGHDLQEMLSAANERGTYRSTPDGPDHLPDAQPNTVEGFPGPAASTAEEPKPAATESLDVGPYVLRALALRKQIHLGQTTEADAEEELRALFDDEATALNAEQRASVRQWAGL